MQLSQAYQKHRAQIGVEANQGTLRVSRTPMRKVSGVHTLISVHAGMVSVAIVLG